MHISAHAVSGQVTAGTFSVKVTVGGQTGIALIDTGSSSTFIVTLWIYKTSKLVKYN
jgi:predicted aspartyl protease